MKSLMKIVLSIVVSVFFALSLFSCADFFQTKIPMSTDAQESNLYDLMNPNDDAIVLQPPAQVFASQGLYSGVILISWQSAEHATSYRVERAVIKPDANGNYKTPEEADFYVLKAHYYKTLYTDVILSNPSYNNEQYKYRYYYRVSSENIKLNLDASDFTDFTSANTEGLGWLFAAPSNAQATKGKSSDSITITWDKVQGAYSYNIYRDTRSDFSSASCIGSVLGNVFSYLNAIPENDQGKEFYYKISAVNSSGNESAQSSVAMGYALQAGAPAAPESVTVENGYGTSVSSLTVKWSEVANTSATGGKLQYSVYRTSSVDSVYILRATVDEGTSTYEDTSDLQPGVYYYYYIQSVITEPATSESESVVLKSAFTETGAESKKPAMGFLLSPPASVEVLDSSTAGNVYVVWAKSVGSDYADFTYNVYVSDDNESYEKVNGAEEISGSDYSRIDSSYENYLYVELTKRNFFKISTCNKNGNDKESLLSSAAAPLPEAPRNVFATKTALLKENFTPNDNGVYPVLITWDKPANDTPAAYYIYRSTDPNSSYRRITDTAVNYVNSDGKYYYYDINDTAKVGTFYFYKVVSLNSLEQGKKSNEPANDSARNSWGYGALTRESWFVAYNKNIFSSQAKLTLMHKSGNTAKLGSETATAEIAVNGKKGTLSYDAGLSGFSGRVKMHYTDYADYYISDNPNYGIYFVLNGDTNTSAGADTNGTMDGTVVCSHSFNKGVFIGMYPGEVVYDGVKILGGAAGGGVYKVSTKDLSGNVVLNAQDISWTYGNEGK